MRKTLVFLFILSVKLALCQVNDAFDDGDFTKNPTWVGDEKMFNVNTNSQLQTEKSGVAQHVSLATINFLSTNVKWEFDLQLRFDPSITNQVRIYLISDKSALNASLKGYFIQIGEAGSADSYDLYRQNGTTLTKIIDGPPKNRLDANLLTAKVRVTRDHLGNWQLVTAIDGSNSFVLEGAALDFELTNCSWFGVNCTYTATRSEGFFFDNFNIAVLAADIFPPQLINVKVINDYHLEATFSEQLELNSALKTNHYLLSGLGNPTTVKTTLLPQTYELVFGTAFPSGNCELITQQLADLKGNVQTKSNSYFFVYVKPYLLKKDDLLISEVLANPKTGGVDFVEIYNNTDQLLDLKNLKLANIDSKGNVANLNVVSVVSVYMPAKSYWVLSTNPDIIKQSYHVRYPNQMIKMSSMPAYNNDKGTVVLLTDQLMIDRFDYQEKMHSPLLKDIDGVSLERISFEVPTNEPGNFTSAAMDVGFATPSYRNSTQNLSTVKNTVNLLSQTFSPDGDGFEDLLQIEYHFVAHGNFATVTIYSDRGTLVKKLKQNISVSTDGNFYWDGTNDLGSLCSVGIYIIKFDTFNSNGSTNSFKKTCVLAAKLK